MSVLRIRRASPPRLILAALLPKKDSLHLVRSPEPSDIPAVAAVNERAGLDPSNTNELDLTTATTAGKREEEKKKKLI